MIWIIAGTGDSKKLINELQKYNIIITTATHLGAQRFKHYPQHVAKSLTLEEMEIFIRENNIHMVIDATHPFAKEVSMHAITVCAALNIHYVRYERKSIEIKKTYLYDTYQSIIDIIEETKGNILLTIGINNLFQFFNIKRERIFVKILPHYDSFCECKNAGIIEDHILALKGIISIQLLRGIIKEYNIEHLVMKESGYEGGTLFKMKACQKEHIIPYVLKRPRVKYPVVFHNPREIVKYLKTREEKNG